MFDSGCPGFGLGRRAACPAPASIVDCLASLGPGHRGEAASKGCDWESAIGEETGGVQESASQRPCRALGFRGGVVYGRPELGPVRYARGLQHQLPQNHTRRKRKCSSKRRGAAAKLRAPCCADTAGIPHRFSSAGMPAFAAGHGRHRGSVCPCWRARPKRPCCCECQSDQHSELGPLAPSTLYGAEFSDRDLRGGNALRRCMAVSCFALCQD